GGGQAANTVRRLCGRARQLFKAAKKKRLIAENPFEDMADTSVKSNLDRDYFVTLDEAHKVLTACRTAQERLVFALSRFGGLRCPSEHALLKSAEVDWDSGRFTVHSPKTEHHEGGDKREVPIFAELRPYLNSSTQNSERV